MTRCPHKNLHLHRVKILLNWVSALFCNTVSRDGSVVKWLAMRCKKGAELSQRQCSEASYGIYPVSPRNPGWTIKLWPHFHLAPQVRTRWAIPSSNGEVLLILYVYEPAASVCLSVSLCVWVCVCVETGFRLNDWGSIPGRAWNSFLRHLEPPPEYAQPLIQRVPRVLSPGAEGPDCKTH
jgi:hypothetical protein